MMLSTGVGVLCGCPVRLWPGHPQEPLAGPAGYGLRSWSASFRGCGGRLSGPSDWPEVQWKNTSAVMASKQASWDRYQWVVVSPST
jgi:hypothetical protein